MKNLAPIIASTLSRIMLVAFVVLALGCGNGSDNVTHTTTAPSSGSNENVVPDAQILLAELPELRTTVYFDSKSYDLTSDGQLLLDPIAVRLRQHPDSYVIVVGHSDDFSNEDDNVGLSYERAFTIAIYISSVFGVEEERIQIVSAGSTEPLSSGSREVDKQRNRRVEVVSPKSIVRTLSPANDAKF
ncbi:OmpA family protein [Photobacterium sp. DNB23_23_1]|uniref:OmpA family protein n=1 Tax=Photobacterium pectinilyticum TaxID=2906793 RepID=A0ABT1MWQ0_9GAMM|nr:OmpA family protein [Photobacterium sp. ZSDE20]MCQ1056908.1 OmpA family protein [Photobacterium sp. ZSDE20]MDD1821043.1 OmpA family protein [Photobacterium sp. ZSDE20]